MTRTPNHHPARSRWVAALALVAVPALAACPGPHVTRDLNDQSAPTLTLSAAGTRGQPGFVDVTPNTTVGLTRESDLVLLATAADPGGVSRVEVWLTTTTTCPADNGLVTTSGPGLVGAPVEATDATLTATTAPSRLSASHTVTTTTKSARCHYEYDVWVVGYNAATNRVKDTGARASFVLPATTGPLAGP